MANGRGHIPKHPVFYCATDAVTAMLEVASDQEEEMIYVSEWKVRSTRNVTFTPVLLLSMSKKNAAYGIAEELASAIPDLWKECAEYILYAQAIIQKQADLYMKEEAPYPFSSMYATSSLYEVIGVDMIMYPSSKQQKRTCNLAIHPTSSTSSCTCTELLISS